VLNNGVLLQKMKSRWAKYRAQKSVVDNFQFHSNTANWRVWSIEGTVDIYAQISWNVVLARAPRM